MSFDLSARLAARRADHLYRHRPLLDSPQDATDEHREGVGKDDAKPEDQPVKTQYWGINIYFSSFGGK